MRRKIDQYFKKGLNLPQEPPAESWEFISQRIAKKEKKRILPFWLKTSGIAALFLLIIGGGYMIEHGFNPQRENQDNVKPPQNISSEQSIGHSSGSGIIETENQVSSYPSHGQTNSASPDNLIARKAYAGFVMPALKSETENEKKESSFHFLMNDPNPDNSQNTENLQQQNKLNPALPKIAWEIPVWNPSIFENTNSENATKQADQESLPVAVSDSKQKEKNKPYKNKRTDFDRFYIAGFASPMALNTFVGNSMLADEMSQYETDNNITLAYGIKAGYAISPTVKIRTGASMIGFEQITKDVPLASNIQGRNLPAVDQVNNVNYNGNLRIDNSLSASLSDNELNNKVGNGNIQQQSSYVEIPLEAEVSLFQTSSIGISATAGGSTWLLSKNKIYVHTDDYTEELGKANNLNKVSFSANAGLKFDLNLSEKVKLNLEPNFKYLVNPVNDIKNYNPYTVGVNAGISVSLK